jgi:hypothetical protein
LPYLLQVWRHALLGGLEFHSLCRSGRPELAHARNSRSTYSPQRSFPQP